MDREDRRGGSEGNLDRDGDRLKEPLKIHFALVKNNLIMLSFPPPGTIRKGLRHRGDLTCVQLQQWKEKLLLLSLFLTDFLKTEPYSVCSSVSSYSVALDVPFCT